MKKCGTGGKVSMKKMADGGKPPKGKPDRSIFGITKKKRVKTKYGSITGQGKRTKLDRSEPSTGGKSNSRVEKTIKISTMPSTHKNVRFLKNGGPVKSAPRKSNSR